MSDIALATIPVLGSKLRSGELSSVELTRFFLDRLEKLGPKYHCLTTLMRDSALAEAKAADEALARGVDRGPLHGIPCGVKDLLATKGYPTTWGCAPYRSRVIDRDAAVVVRLRAAGAVVAAKLSMVECAGGMGYRQANASLDGPGLNPWKPTQWSGGSSSGSGSAVAAGLVPFAIGTETWGSITTPSSYCGLTGLRPTFGRVSKAGAMALSWTLDKIGPMARTAHDCGLVLDAIAGPDPDDHSTSDRAFEFSPINDRSQRRFKLAVLRKGVDRAQPEVKAGFERARKVFETFSQVDEIDEPEGPFTLVTQTILGAEMASAFEEMIDSGTVFDLTAPEDRIGGFARQTVLAVEYLKAQRLRGGLARSFDRWFADYDAVLTVPTAGTAPSAEGSFGGRYSSKSLGGPGNLCGTPALVMPTGLDSAGLPTAIQLDGRAFSENVLLALGEAFQGATGHHLAFPKDL
ncbi:MAG: amidase [Isosphaeraceae bacterium]|nr:amidase [Isosphaeraceae bacterium]